MEVIENRKPKGHYLGKGIAFGISISVPLGLLAGILLDRVSLGITLIPVLGVAIGAAIGSYRDKRQNPALEKEPVTAKRRWLAVVSIGIGLVVLLTYLYLKI